AGLGGIDPEELAAGEHEALEKVLLELYRDAPDGATHSAAGWALRQWKVALPAIPHAPRPPGGRHWFVNARGMTMLEVPPGVFTMGHPAVPEAPPHPVYLSRPFFMCDREVRGDLYREF